MATTGFSELDYTKFNSNTDERVKYFLNDLRSLLDKHKIKLYSHECEVYIEGQGYIGYLEDNVETIDIVEGEETLYSSQKSITIDQ
jgi:hypothetical protein